jgi:hypothetical protein
LAHSARLVLATSFLRGHWRTVDHGAEQRGPLDAYVLLKYARTRRVERALRPYLEAMS